MIAALAYLQLMTLVNALRRRLRRLRQPRYLVAAIVGAGYFYFVFFRHFSSPRQSGGLAAFPELPGSAAEWTGLLESVGALLLFVAVALNWIVPRERAALSFTEAEVGFLFPAPVSRRTLVQFKLLKSQLAILFTALVFSFFSRRGGFLGGSAWIHVAGWWLILSVFNLHVIGASFARERLLSFGINAARRRLLVGGVLLLIGLATGWWQRKTLPPWPEVFASSSEDLWRYGQAVIAAPPLGWVLVPFRWVVRPFLATDAVAFAQVLWPAVLLLLGHYVWVVRSDVAFEEASVALAQKRAERLAAVRAGQWRVPSPGGKPRREPFALAPTGPAPVAFLWKGLLAAGPFYYPRSWAILAVVLISGVLWLTHDPTYEPLVKVVVVVSATIGLQLLLLGPMLVRRGQRQMIERLDLVKSYPVRGWQVVLGELLCPTVLLSAAEWLLLALIALALGAMTTKSAVTPLVAASGAVSLGLLVPPLAALLFSIPFAAALYFPVWMNATGQPGGGLEVMGQRLIFFGGYLVMLIATLLPAAAVGVGPFFLVRWWSGSLVPAQLAAALAASATLVAEFGGILWWLGRRYEHFDLSAELPP